MGHQMKVGTPDSISTGGWRFFDRIGEHALASMIVFASCDQLVWCLAAPRKLDNHAIRCSVQGSCCSRTKYQNTGSRIVG